MGVLCRRTCESSTACTMLRSHDPHKAPGFFLVLFTIGISMALWVDRTNKTLAQGGAGFAFAWLLAPFAYYGLAGRLNTALAAQGSRTQISPLMCFFFPAFPFIGARKRLGRAAYALAR